MTSNYSKYRKRKIAVLAIILFLIFAVSASYVFIDLFNDAGDYIEDDDSLKDTISYNGDTFRLKDGIESVLVLGLDKASADQVDPDNYNNDMKSDFVLLLVFDNNKREYTAVQLNRDTMADIDILDVAGDPIGTVKRQLSLAYTYGNGREVSCRNVAEAVSRLLLNINIKTYVSVAMDAVPIYNDLIGGVDVTVEDDFSGIDSTLVKGQTVTLMGEHALTFIRARQGVEDQTNINRMSRQREYLKAAQQKTASCIKQDSGFAAKAYLKTADYIITNTTDKKLQDMLKKSSSYDFKGIKTIDGKSVKGKKYMEFYLDEDAVMETIIDLYYE